MCGIILSNLEIKKEYYKFISNRGPDVTNYIHFNGLFFVHFLLNVTGEITPQPIIDNNIICIFNGEIYNYKEILRDAKSDCYSIIEAYKKYDEEFIKYLDGEFVIILLDFNKNKLFICSDIFKTKPLFYNINKDIVISSYESTCKLIKNQNYQSINPNEVLVFDLNNNVLLKKYKIFTFDLEQKKDNYDDFCVALENAILKRYPEHTIPIISLSSGTDSGVIACCLQKYKKKAIYFTINKNENNEIIEKRKKILHNNHFIISIEEYEKNYWKDFLNNNCEKCYWDWRYHPKMRNYVANAFDMGSMLGKCKILHESKKMDKNSNVLFSGIGADEVMAFNHFYSQGYGNVDYFPNNLNEVFPWPNFFNGSMENYLKGDEYVGGCFGFETRYPFCDKYLIQEFLWLKPNLKNNYKNTNYKPALTYYLDKEQFPLHVEKLGFNI